jgi:hypothetical protein
MTYYKDQLAKLSGDIQVKFTSSDGSTNYMNLNLDSIKEIEHFLSKVRADIITDLKPDE